MYKKNNSLSFVRCTANQLANFVKLLFYLLNYLCNFHWCATVTIVLILVSAIHSSKWKNLKNFFQTYIKWNIKIQLTYLEVIEFRIILAVSWEKNFNRYVTIKKINDIYSHLFTFWYQNSLSDKEGRFYVRLFCLYIKIS